MSKRTRCPKCSDDWYVVPVGCPKKASRMHSSRSHLTPGMKNHLFGGCRLTRHHRHYYCCNTKCSQKDSKGFVTQHYYFVKTC